MFKGKEGVDVDGFVHFDARWHGEHQATSRASGQSAADGAQQHASSGRSGQRLPQTRATAVPDIVEKHRVFSFDVHLKASAQVPVFGHSVGLGEGNAGADCGPFA